MEKFTKGEWVIDGFNTTAVLSMTVKYGSTGEFRQYQHICDCNYGYAEPEKHIELNKANAALIASAPELYEALKAFVTDIDNPPSAAAAEYYKPLLDKAKAALTKATTI